MNIPVDQEGDQDQDSLFGSPPPTPIRGRSPSPCLALPNASSSAQNVGTIALPGSHHCSELPVHPLALSSSYALNGLALRPPAQLQSSQGPSPPVSQIHTPSTCSPSISRASSAAPHLKKKTFKKAVSKESTPRLPGPEITLPDPSDHPPTNFLRNQSGLLGTAGLVGGVKPAKLSQRHNRGTNPANPIIVEDQDDTPKLGRTSKFRHPYTPPVDPSLLSTPPIQDVVSTLIDQKDIFLILENLLKLIASGSSGSSLHHDPSSPDSGNQRRPVSSTTLSTRPTKKRKLNRVPAGAVDWDVPYPFPPGEGPNEYRTNWEQERGKQLLTQLLALIKSAARKAATKIYHQSGDARRTMVEAQKTASGNEDAAKVRGHYRPVTATYGLEKHAAPAGASAQKVRTDACGGSGGPIVGRAPSWQASPCCAVSASGVEHFSTPFDQLVSSLVAASPKQSAGQEKVFHLGQANSGATASISKPSDEGLDNNIDQGLYDNWMNILQTFPLSSEGFSQSVQQLQDVGSLSTLSSAADPEDFGLMDFSFDYGSAVQSISDSQCQTGADASLDKLVVVADYLINPALLDPPVPQPTEPNTAIGPLSLAPSPASSVGTPGPATPNLANWETSMPQVYMGTNSDGGFDNAWGHQNRLGGQAVGDDYADVLLGGQESIRKQEKGKGRAMQGIQLLPTPNVQGQVTEPAHNLHHGDKNLGVPTITSGAAHLTTLKLPERSLNKEDILRCANQRRAQLKAELERVRTQLWETTIEQGVLAQLMKH